MLLKPTLLAIILTLSITGTVYADSVGAPPAKSCHHGMMDPVAMAHKHLARMQAALHITADQQTTWQAFADKVTAQAQQMADGHKAMRDSNATHISGPDLMAQHADMMQQHAQSMSATAQSAKTLYAQLKTDQRNTFDALVKDQHRNMMKMAKQHSSNQQPAATTGNVPSPAQ